MADLSHAIEVYQWLTGCWYCSYDKEQRADLAHKLFLRLPAMRKDREELGHAHFHYIQWVEESTDKDGNVIETIPRYKICWVQKVGLFENRTEK